MKKLLRSFPARCWYKSLLFALMMLIASVNFSSYLLEAIARFSVLIFMICSVIFFCYLIFKVTSNTLGLIIFGAGLAVSAYVQSSLDIFVLGLIFLAVSSFIRSIRHQIKSTGRKMSLEEKKYWFWVNEYQDGRTSIYPKKPRS